MAHYGRLEPQAAFTLYGTLDRDMFPSLAMAQVKGVWIRLVALFVQHQRGSVNMDSTMWSGATPQSAESLQTRRGPGLTLSST